MFKGDNIKGYVISADFTTAGGGLSKWTFARKNGLEYFIKEFLFPKYPTKDAPGSPQSKARKKIECERFEAYHRTLMQEINEKCSAGGNLVYAVDFFRHESKYYKVTEKIDVSSLIVPEIADLPLPTRVLILKTISHSLGILHRANIVHGDLKPDNVLIKQTKTGNFTAKLIDFDNSYFSSKPPELSEEMVGDMVYYSPELALYIQDTKQVDYKLLTTQSDIFALGLLFSQYLTGKLPYFEQEKYQYACIAVNAGKSLDFTAENLPPTLVQLLHEMLAPKPTERPTITVIFDFLKQLDLKDYLTEKDFQRPASLLTGTMKEKNGKYDLPQQESGLKGKGLGILKGKK